MANQTIVENKVMYCNLHFGADVAAVAVLPGITILVGMVLVVFVVATIPGLGANASRVVGCICMVVFGNWTLTSWLGVVEDIADVTNKKKTCIK